MKKTAKPKRADPPRLANYTKVFLKDWQRLSHSGRYDMARLREVMLLLMANDTPLGPEWLDHPPSRTTGQTTVNAMLAEIFC
ncbi:MAG: hypothetical protein ACKO69_01855 [Limnohabitans sp.]